MPKSWVRILSVKFMDEPGRQLLCCEQVNARAELFSIDGSAALNRELRYLAMPRNLHSMVRGHFKGRKFDDLLYYHSGRGEGDFQRTLDGHGSLQSFRLHTNWRNTWRFIVAGSFELNGRHDGLLFVQRGNGFSEMYGTDGTGGMRRLDVQFGSAWLSRASRWRAVLAGDFIGTSFGSDLCAYSAEDGTISFFQLAGHG